MLWLTYNLNIFIQGHNAIYEIDGIETLRRLQCLDLSGNRIASLSGLDNHDLLSDVDLEDNEIGSIDELSHVAGLDLLRKLNLMRNPIVVSISLYEEIIASLEPVILNLYQRAEQLRYSASLTTTHI